MYFLSPPTSCDSPPQPSGDDSLQQASAGKLAYQILWLGWSCWLWSLQMWVPLYIITLKATRGILNFSDPSILFVRAVRLARLKADGVFTAPCNTSVLYPTSGGNIHAFTAITPCAMLDVLGPPYSKEDGRDCSYYKDFLYTAHSSKKTLLSVWLAGKLTSASTFHFHTYLTKTFLRIWKFYYMSS